MTSSQFYLIRSRALTEFPPEQWIKTCQDLKDAGLDPGEILSKQPNLLMRRASSPKDVIAALSRMGFKNPIKMVKQQPAVLGYNIYENIIPKIAMLARLGFKDPIKMVEKDPGVFSYSVEETILPKIDSLTHLGFENPIKLIEENPTVLGLNIEGNVAPKMAGLSQLGFKNPVRLITKLSTILDYSLDQNIIPKIGVLTRLGFENPIKMIEAQPALLGLSVEGNLVPTVNHLVFDWKIPNNHLESNPRLISASLKRVKELFHFLKQNGVDPGQLPIDHKDTCIKSLSVEDILANSNALGFSDLADLPKALSNRSNLKRIFTKARDCSKSLVNQSSEKND